MLEDPNDNKISIDASLFQMQDRNAHQAIKSSKDDLDEDDDFGQDDTSYNLEENQFADFTSKKKPAFKKATTANSKSRKKLEVKQSKKEKASKKSKSS